MRSYSTNYLSANQLINKSALPTVGYAQYCHVQYLALGPAKTLVIILKKAAH